MTGEPTPKAIGRPTSFTAEVATAICARVMDGAILADICRDADMPDRCTVYRWFKVNVDFRNMYAHAREARADMIADQVIDIADTEPDANKARVRIDARKWYAAKLNPKRYGNRTMIAGDHDAPLPPLTIELVAAQFLAQITPTTGLPPKPGAAEEP
jgi:hypothetical protein